MAVEVFDQCLALIEKVPNEPRLEPEVATSRRGRPSTRHLPSKFERVKQSIKTLKRATKRKLSLKGKEPARKKPKVSLFMR